ncbi:Cytoplasmic phosphatidylinositol transfer protein 1, partial [Operophtera brumata]
YRIGQLYMIARHSFEQSSNGEGVEVISNEKVTDEVNGEGQFTEKRIHLSSARSYQNYMDIAYDEIKPHHYKEAEDPKYFKSEKTGRGPLVEGWRDSQQPIMCCYKAVSVRFEVWGLQTKVEEYAQSAIREVLLLGHRQAFTWMDDWFNMTIDDVREYERDMQTKTNDKVGVGRTGILIRKAC